MFKRKQQFKEDKSQIMNIKPIAAHNIQPDANVVDSEENAPTRGRQLGNKSLSTNKKTQIISSQASTCESKGKAKIDNNDMISSIHSKILRNKSKSKLLNVYSLGISTVAVESEDYPSSDSECSLKYKKRRELGELYEQEILETFKNYRQRGGENESLNSSQDHLNNANELTNEITNEISDSLSHNCEDNLNNEIERILIDIYNNHITLTNKRRTLDISKYEKHVIIFFIFNIYFLLD